MLFGVLAFLLASAFEGAAHARTTLVQWTDEARMVPVGEPEEVLLGPVPRIPGQGGEGSVFVATRYKPEAVPFERFRRTFLLAKVGALGLVIVGFLGSGVLRLQRIGLGATPD